MKINTYLTLSLSLLIFFTSLSHQSNPPYYVPNPRLQNAYIALQALKHSITSDPNNVTSNWYGYDVCTYSGVYCAPALDDSHVITVAGIDLNHDNIAGLDLVGERHTQTLIMGQPLEVIFNYSNFRIPPCPGFTGTLPEDLGLLTDLALFHINSNRFTGTLPKSFRHFKILFELDVSNNLFTGEFPQVVLTLSNLKFLDIRFNRFCGEVPTKVFDLKLDALFFNSNKFSSSLPGNFGNSPVSVIVLANNNLNGCFPASITKMSKTLNEIILSNVGLNGCLPSDIGHLKAVAVFDVSSNRLTGGLPASIGGMRSLERLNVKNNRLSGEILPSICGLPKLKNFTYSNNFFCSEPKKCLKLKVKNDRENCIPWRPHQRSVEECVAFYSHPVKCGRCSLPPPPPPPHYPPPPHKIHY